MFDFDKLGDMSKMAKEAKEIQKQQSEFQSKQIELLKDISLKLDKLISIIKSKGFD